MYLNFESAKRPPTAHPHDAIRGWHPLVVTLQMEWVRLIGEDFSDVADKTNLMNVTNIRDTTKRALRCKIKY